MKNTMYGDGYINQTDLDTIVLTDDVDLIVREFSDKFMR